MNNKILIVDDDNDILVMLKEFFEYEGYCVYTANNGSQALDRISVNPDIILLDVSMPDLSGLDVCKRIREHISCPILFLTAKIEEADRILGFAVGGDDYILKPFQIGELSARVAAHLRRENRAAKQSMVRFCGEFTIDYSNRTIKAGDTSIPLTRKEFDIIEFLSLHQGQIFSKEQIYEKIWGYDAEGDSGVIAEHVRRIRKKFTAHTSEEILQTVWGVGYQWIAKRNL